MTLLVTTLFIPGIPSSAQLTPFIRFFLTSIKTNTLNHDKTIKDYIIKEPSYTVSHCRET